MLTTYIHQLSIYALLLLLGAATILLFPYGALVISKAIASSKDNELGVIQAAFTVCTCLFLLIFLFFVRSRRPGEELAPSYLGRLRTCLLTVSTTVVCLKVWLMLAARGAVEAAYVPVFAGIFVAHVINSYWTHFETRPEERRRVCALLGVLSAAAVSLAFYTMAAYEKVKHSLPPYLSLVSSYRSLTSVSKVNYYLTCVLLLLLIAAFITQPFLARISKLRRYPAVSMILTFAVATMLLYCFVVYVWSRADDITWHIQSLTRAVGTSAAVPLVWLLLFPAFLISGSLGFNFCVAVLSRFLTPYTRESAMQILALTFRYALIILVPSIVAFMGPVCAARPSCAGAPVVALVFAGFCMVGNSAVLSGRNDFLARLVRSSSRVLLGYSGLVLYLVSVSWLNVHFVLHQKLSADVVTFWQVLDTLDGSIFGAIVTTAGLLLLLSARFGINSSSVHLFFQSRLSRTFLDEYLPGSARFDSVPKSLRATALSNYVPSKENKHSGPYLLINATLNLSRNNKSLYSGRVASNFVFSPLYFGYESWDGNGQPDRGYYLKSSSLKYGGEDGVRLGQAIAISASAVGTAMGLYTSLEKRLIGTLLNLRLGWWFPNPRFPESVTGAIPRSRVALIFQELAGQTNAEGPYVNLSDGGHFENLGLYELVKRRCTVIVVSDATSDANERGLSLASAIARCRLDFGAEIAFPEGADIFTKSVSVGRVVYSDGLVGVLLYIKARLPSKTPTDIESFRRSHKSFPHYSTTDQWFSETMFEAYRRLGQVLGEDLVAALAQFGGTLRERATSLQKSAFSSTPTLYW